MWKKASVFRKLLRRQHPMKISNVILILLFMLSGSVISSRAQPPQENITVKVIPQRAEYLPNTQVFLKVGLFNVGNAPLEVEIPEGFPQGISVVPADAQRKRGIVLLHDREIREGDPRVEKILTAYRKVKIQAKSALLWELPARFIFTESGLYRLDFTLPEIRVAQGAQLAIQAKGQLEFSVLEEAATLKDGVEISVDLVEPAKGKVDGLKWQLSPPKRVKIPIPYFQFGNCRVVVRDDKNKIVHDLTWESSQAQTPSAEYWKDPVEWLVPMSSASFGLKGNFFPKRGLYTVEAYYRAYISSTGKQATQGQVRMADEFDGGLYITSSELEEKGERPWPAVKPKEVQKLDPKNFVPDKGRWISLSKTFHVEATENSWRKRLP
jgi:hypothetical protein